ncbi:IS3 family transposase [Sphingobacterium sp. InxBP1]
MYKQVKDYVHFYNTQRRHKSLGRITLHEKFYQEIKNVS